MGMTTHLESELHSRLPVCGDAGVDPSDLTTDTTRVNCWECCSIADIPRCLDAAENTDALPAKPVPDLRMTVEGQTFGGAYWDSHTYEVVLECTGIDVRLQVLNSSGDSVRKLILTPGAAFELKTLAQSGQERSLSPAFPGLVQTVVWNLVDDVNDEVQLTHHLEEIGAWLGYALGFETWDYAANGNEWEF